MLPPASSDLNPRVGSSAVIPLTAVSSIDVVGVRTGPATRLGRPFHRSAQRV